MSYKRVVTKKGKSYGPYLYESYRDEKGNVKKRYLGKAPEKKKRFLLPLFFFAMSALLFYAANGYTTENGQVSFDFEGNFFSKTSNFLTGLVVLEEGESSEDSDDSEKSEEPSKEESSKKETDSSSNEEEKEKSGEKTKTEDFESKEESTQKEKVPETKEIDLEDKEEIVSQEVLENSEKSIEETNEAIPEETLEETLEEPEIVEESENEDLGTEEETTEIADEGSEEVKEEEILEEDLEELLEPEEASQEGEETTEESEDLETGSSGNGKVVEVSDRKEINETILEKNVSDLEEEIFFEENETEEFPNNETEINETVSNETGENETVLNETFANETEAREVLLSDLNFTLVQQKAVIGVPVRFVEKLSAEEAKKGIEKLQLQLPKGAQNISILRGGAVNRALKEIESSNEEIKSEGKGEKITGGFLTGNVILGKKSEEGIFTKFWDWMKGFTISGRVISGEELEEIVVESEEGTTVLFEEVFEEEVSQGLEEFVEFAIQYYTPAPELDESFIREGKRIVVDSGNYEYGEVLAYLNVKDLKIKLPLEGEGAKLYRYPEFENLEKNNPESLLTGNVIRENPEKLSVEEILEKTRILKGKRILTPYDSYDEDSDGYIDYIEWTTPDSSTQTYELIIEITDAKHLDLNREFIRDIYNETYLQDGIWSEPVYVGEYVRVTFESNLTSERDITIFAREEVEESNVSVEVYLENGTEKIADFPIVTSAQYHKIYLTNMTGEHDVFDLKVVKRNGALGSNDSISFDHIIDPIFGEANISFVAPTAANNSVLDNYDPVEINISVTNVSDLDSFVYNWDGTNYTRYDERVILKFNFDNVSSLGENQTYVYDVSGGINNGTANGSIPTTEGIFGGGYLFDGVDDSICPWQDGVCDNALGLSDVFEIAWRERTYSIWVYINSSLTDRRVIFEEGGASSGLNFYVEGGNITYGIWSNQAGDVDTWHTTPTTANEWHHLAATHTTENISSFYVNGQLVSSVDYGAGMNKHTGDGSIGKQESHSRYFGVSNNSDAFYFKGIIDEFEIFNNSMTADEINQLYMTTLQRTSPLNWTLSVNQTGTARYNGLQTGLYGFYGWANDTVGTANTTELRTVNLSGILPLAFVSPTPANNSVVGESFVEINISMQDLDNLTAFTFTWDGTEHTIFDNAVVGYNFDNSSALGENDSLVFDVAENGNNGTVSGAVHDPNGRYNGAYAFDGVDDFICLDTLTGNCDGSDENPSFDDLVQERTISTWFKVNQTDRTQIIFEEGTSISGLNIYVDSGAVYGGTWAPSFVDTWFNSSISTDTWHHATLTFRDTNGTSFYLDGELIGNSATGGGNVSAHTADDALGAMKQGTSLANGSGSSEDGFYFNGSIDEFFVYDRLFSAAEVQELYMSNLYQINETSWNFYINQTKNASDGLDPGTYTYEGFANEGLGSTNSTELRTVIVEACDITSSTTLSSNIICLDNFSISAGQTLNTAGYNISVGNFSVILGNLNMTGESILNHTNANGGIWRESTGWINATGTSSSQRVFISGSPGWNFETRLLVSTNYATFENMENFSHVAGVNSLTSLNNIRFQGATSTNYAVIINTTNVISEGFDWVEIITEVSNSQALYWDTQDTYNSIERLNVSGPSSIIEVLDDNLTLNRSYISEVNLTNNSLSWVESTYHNNSVLLQVIWPGQHKTKHSEITEFNNKDLEIFFRKDADLEPVNFLFDTDAFVDQWHMPAYGASSNKSDYEFYFDPGVTFTFDDDSEAAGEDGGFIDYSATYGDTRLNMYLNGSGWGAGNQVEITAQSIDPAQFNSGPWDGLFQDWAVGGKREYLNLSGIDTWWETQEGAPSTLENIHIFRGESGSGTFNVRLGAQTITNLEFIDTPVQLRLWGGSHVLINLSSVGTATTTLRNQYGDGSPNYLINSSVDLSKILWDDVGARNRSFISKNHNDVLGNYVLAIKDSGDVDESNLPLSEITDSNFTITDSDNVTLFSGNFIIDQDFNVTSFNASAGQGGYQSLTVHDDIDFRVDHFEKEGTTTFQVGNGSFSAYQATEMLANFETTSGFVETNGPNVSNSNATGDVIEAYNSIDGGNNYRWRFNATVITLSPANDTFIGEDNNFTCNATNDFELKNLSLWHDYSGTLTLNQTTTVSGNSNGTTFSLEGFHSEKYLHWQCEVCDEFECVNSSLQRHTIDTDNYNITINSSLALNRTGEDLSCLTVINDYDGNNVSIEVDWYNETSLILTQNYANQTNGSLFEATFDSGNTTRDENWTCSMTFDNNVVTSQEVNSTSLTIENTPPVVTLNGLNPPLTTSNRTPFFAWTTNDVDGDTTFTYEWNLTEVITGGAAICDDDRLVGGITELNYTVQGPDLLCLTDNLYEYHWKVRGNDGIETGSYSANRTVGITTDLDFNLTTDNIAFTLGAPGSFNDTTTNLPLPFVIENLGNVFMNITLNATQLWDEASGTSSYFQFKAANTTGEPGSFNESGSVTTFTNVPVNAAAILAIDKLNYTDENDTVEVDIYVEVPPDELASNKGSVILFTGSLGE